MTKLCPGGDLRREGSLERHDLHNIKLCGANLEGRKIYSINLGRANLELTDFLQINLSGANPSYRQLQGTIFDDSTQVEHRAPTPSAASLDAQTVSTAVMWHESVGDNGGKKIKGRKRFTLVDPLGLLIAVRVVAANVPEREGAKQLLKPA